MTKREREENLQSELQANEPCLERPTTTAQITGTSQPGLLPVDPQISVDGPATGEGVTSALYIGETPGLDEVANDATTATLEGDYGPFWSLLARAGYTIW